MDGADGGAGPTLLIARLHIGGIHLDDLAVEFGRSLRHPTGRSHCLGHPTRSLSPQVRLSGEGYLKVFSLHQLGGGLQRFDEELLHPRLQCHLVRHFGNSMWAFMNT